MSSQNEIAKAYLEFIPYRTIISEYEITREDLLYLVANKGYRQQRAEELIGKLEDLDDKFPTLIKEAIWKMQIIRFIAGKYNSKTASDFNLVEKIANYAIKARLEDYSTWGSIDYSGGLEVSIISNEHKLDIEWVCAQGDDNLSGLADTARTLRDKVSLQDNIKEVVVVSEEHIAECKKHGITNPMDYTPEELREFVESLEFMSNLEDK